MKPEDKIFIAFCFCFGLLVAFSVGYGVGFQEPEQPRIVPIPIDIEGTTIALNESMYSLIWLQYFDITREYNENYSYFLSLIVFSVNEPNSTLIARFDYSPSTYAGANIWYEAYAHYHDNSYHWMVVDFDISPPLLYAQSSKMIGFIFVGYSEVELPMSFYPAGLEVVAYQEVGE